MIIVNPYYIILNIVFVDTRRRTVFIKREVWNETVRLLGINGKRLDRTELSRFKKELYYMYLAYMKNGFVDYNRFNKLVCELIGMSYEPIEQQTSSSTNEPRLIFDDSEYIEEESQPYLNETETFENIKSVENQVRSIPDLTEKAEFGSILNSKIAAQLDYFQNYSLIRKQLVDLVGFGLLRSGYIQLFTQGFYFCKNTEQFLLYKLDLDFLSTILFYNNECQKHKHIKLSFICDVCESIGEHSSVERGRGNLSLDIAEHSNKVTFFSYKGSLENYKDELVYHKFQVRHKESGRLFTKYDDVEEYILKFSLFKTNGTKVFNYLQSLLVGFQFTIELSQEILDFIISHQVFVKLNKDNMFFFDFNINCVNGLIFNDQNGYSGEVKLVESPSSSTFTFNSFSFSNPSSIDSPQTSVEQSFDNIQDIFQQPSSVFGSSISRHKRTNTRNGFFSK